MGSFEATTAPRQWRRVKWTRAGQIAAQLDGLVDLQQLYDQPPAQAFAALRMIDLVQATRFIAQCLPRMEALRWAAACIALMPPTDLPARLVAKKAVNRWIAEPSDANRRIAFEAGEFSGLGTAEGAACAAVFFSGGSIAPATLETPVPPPQGAFGQAIAGAILMAALGEGPQHFERCLAALIDLGEKAAAGEALQG